MSKSIYFGLLLVAISVKCLPTFALDNGLAKTPPMGWMDWERFRCVIDCVKEPSTCISEHLITSTADLMVKDGYRDAGYKYVSIDDCWAQRARDPQGKLVADPKRFPHGIKYLADYLHKLGLKLGIYGDVGIATCAGYPGSAGHFDTDAQTFAAWGVDMLKLDGCNTNKLDYHIHFPQMGRSLNKSGRAILYDCGWPDFMEIPKLKPPPNYTLIANSCNMWRNYVDIDDSWDRVKQIINFYGNNTHHFLEAARPGAWNSADQLIIGDFSLSLSQQRAQFAMWAIFPSPMFMSAKLDTIPDESRAILLNRNVIAIHQDPLGLSGHRIKNLGNIQIWRRSLSNNTVALAFLDTGTNGVPGQISGSLKQWGVGGGGATAEYYVYEVFSNTKLGKLNVNSMIQWTVDLSGVLLVKCIPALSLTGASAERLV